MGPYRRRSDAELYELPVGVLLAHIRAARAHGDVEQEKLAQDVLAFREEPRIVARIRGRCPRVPDWVHREIAGNVLESALGQLWRGAQVGSFRAWLNTMIAGEICEFFRTARGRALLEQRSLDDPHQREALGRRDAGGESLLDGLERTLRLDAAARALEELRERNGVHARAVELALWGDRPSREVAEECGLSVANVDQLKRRFRVEVRRRVEEG